MKKHNTALDAILAIQSGQRVFIQGGAATPNRLIDALLERADRLRDVELFHLHTVGPAKYCDTVYRPAFKVSSFFVGSNLRSRIDLDRIDYIPCFLSEIPDFFRKGRIPLDVALIHVSSPDTHGFCTLGTSVDVTRSAIDTAKVVIAQINPRMPRVHGDGFIHVDQIHHSVEVDDPIPEELTKAASPVEVQIGKNVASLIEDGSTLQMGIGSIPNSVLGSLKGHRHLGVHSEMWTDGLLELIHSGVVDNSFKKVHPGRTVAGFVIGSKKLYDFINDNPSVVLLDIGYVNNPVNIARNPKAVAINSAVEVDLTGQVCADSVGHRIISGAGGQMDFIRGASLSPGGKPIIALTSRTKRGKPRIVPQLNPGAGVVTTRAHVHYVATEHGVADLYGKTIGQRAKALISIAHPEDRDLLSYHWNEQNN